MLKGNRFSLLLALGGFGGQEIVLLVLLLVLFGVPMWIALKAKRLGTLRYRWATWLAVSSALGCLYEFGVAAAGLVSSAAPITILFAFVSGVIALWTTIGLFRRNKIGAVFAVADDIWVVLVGVWPSLGLQDAGPRIPFGGVLGMIGVAVINFFYFKKRWTLMGSRIF